MAVPFTVPVVCLRSASGMLELENHVQFAAICIGIFFCLFQRHSGSLPYRDQIIVGKHFPVHFF